MAKTASTEQTDPLVARMAELEAQLQAANTRAAELEVQALSRPVAGDSEKAGVAGGPSANTADQAQGTAEGYEFEVFCVDATAGLPRKTVRCCDESEAIRWYAQTTPHAKQPGKALDTAKYRCTARCLEEPRRQAKIILEHKKAFLRMQLKNNGAKDMSAEDLRLIGVVV